MSIQRRLTVCVAALALTSAVGAQPSGADNKELDQRVYKLLRDVINTGAQLYNRPTSDHNGCYRLYQGSVMTLRPLLDHRPALQKAIDEALATAEREPSVTERAFILRAAIDRIRDETGGKATAAKKDTLWERLGGEKNVRKVVEDFVDLEHTDPKVDFFRGGKHKLNDEQLAALKQKIVEFISQAAGGPLKYTGKTMKEAHMGMEITDAQFDALAVDLKTALDKNGVKPADRDAVLDAVAGLRKDVVEKKDGGMPRPKKEPIKKDEEGKEPVKKEDDKPKPKKDDGKKGDKETAAGAKVEGRITLDGKPVAGGTISLVPAKEGAGKPISGEIKEDGSYRLEKVPPGEYTISIAPPTGKEKAKDAVPAKFGSANTSGLVMELKAGTQTHDIALQK
jgi:hemoglobin